MDPDNFPTIWNRFSGELNARCERLCSETEAAWNNLDAILQKHAEKLAAHEWQIPPSDSLASILDLAKTQSSMFLFEPLLSLKKARAQERALHAIDHFQNGIEDLLRILPKRVTVSRKDLQDCLDWKGKWFRHFLLRCGRKPLSFSMRSVAHQELLEHSARRLECDGRLLLLLSRAALAVVAPWQLYRNAALKSRSGSPVNTQLLAEARGDWMRSLSEIRSAGARCAAAYKMWKQDLSPRLTASLLSGDWNLSAKRSDRARDRWQKGFQFWSGQQRVVVAQLELEQASARLLERAAGISVDSLASVDDEHLQILAELDKVNKWLTDWQAKETEAQFPPPEARLISAEDRVVEWNRKLESSGRATLPVHVESVDLKRYLPGGRKKPRVAAAESSFIKALHDVGGRIARNGFGEAEDGHRAIIREIERAREVAAYSIEVGRIESEDDESQQVLRDGIANAISLLVYQKENATDYHPVIDRRLAEAVVSTFLEFHIRLDEGRFDLFTYLARQKGSEAVRTGTEATRSGIRSGFRWFGDQLARFHKYVLLKVGWTPPPTVAVEPVTRGDYLGEVLNLKAGPRQLPAIYRRLFRLSPIEDQRFLVGRDAEMAAAVEARSLWEQGRSVAILVAGARGCGKTSLLNCISSAVFADMPLISSQFQQRITTAQGMRSFLSSLLESDVQDLDRQLQSERRLIVLEEVERTFLRCIGGFQGLHTLLDIIARTSRNTLWILSLNESAFRYLTRAASIEEYFSHRINAMAVAPQHLRNAILLRHNLSGLRLHFAEPSSQGAGKRSLHRLLGFEKDAEEAYFESLYRQSEGIFRSAFELWQQSVDRVEGGVLYMLSPKEPSYAGIISRLTLEDSFVLQAIRQHGSLTPEEVAGVFDLSPDKSMSRIEKMVAWEILEPDPNNPGYRVRPEAGRVVREALYRQNLL